ncbi:MAG: hypothetical protein K0S33_3807 [Bacteroidetes bacterium]|jgi:hypothetical protein|nr:hypothetical protein [Bacteroidota bacterium]
MRVLSIIIFISLTLSALGKGINMDFTVRTDRSVSYKLKLKKDNTYKYIFSSVSWDSQGTLDSGTYQLENNIITFSSKNSQSKDNFADKKYYIKERKLKRYESEYSPSIIYGRKKTLFSKKIVALLKDPNDSIILNKTINVDPIQIEILKPDTSIKQWVCNNVIAENVDSTHWKSVFESKNLHILSVKSLFGITKGVYFLINEKVYYSKDPASMKFNKQLVDKCYKEHLINSIQKKEIVKTIAEWTKN